MKKTKIMVVDDEVDILTFVKTILEFEGYAVLTTTNGEEALSMASTSVPDLIILDVKLPGIDGYEVCRRLKKSQILDLFPSSCLVHHSMMWKRKRLKLAPMISLKNYSPSTLSYRRLGNISGYVLSSWSILGLKIHLVSWIGLGAGFPNIWAILLDPGHSLQDPLRNDVLGFSFS